MNEKNEDVPLYLHRMTLDCVMNNDCVVCLYKLISNNLVSSDNISNISFPSNKRPEMCPRFFQNGLKLSSENSLYALKDNILILGDGDFSFSLSLVKLGHLQITATSYESRESLIEYYPNTLDILDQLKIYNIPVYHNIDASAIKNSSNKIPLSNYDIIVWNFPCVGIPTGADGQYSEIEANKQLIRDFLSNAKDYLSPSGRCEIHITHKTIEPFSWWKIKETALECGFVCLGSIIFDRFFNSYICIVTTSF
jgi:25S rRNA (uracil2634-N3)-methyltransferase